MPLTPEERNRLQRLLDLTQADMRGEDAVEIAMGADMEASGAVFGKNVRRILRARLTPEEPQPIRKLDGTTRLAPRWSLPAEVYRLRAQPAESNMPKEGSRPRPPPDLLHAALEWRDAHTVRFLLRAGWDPNSYGGGMSAAGRAVWKLESAPLAALLWRYGADVSVRIRPSGVANGTGGRETNAKVGQSLLQRMMSRPESDLLNPERAAKAVRFLARVMPDPLAPDAGGRTPFDTAQSPTLIEAARAGLAERDRQRFSETLARATEARERYRL